MNDDRVSDDRPGPVIVYDDACGFCIWTVSLMLALDRRRVLTTAPIASSTTTLLASVPQDTVADSFHVVSPTGEVASAGDALRAVAAAIPVLRIAAYLLGRSPALTHRLYFLVARRRGTLAKVVPARAKERAVHSVLARAHRAAETPVDAAPEPRELPIVPPDLGTPSAVAPPVLPPVADPSLPPEVSPGPASGAEDEAAPTPPTTPLTSPGTADSTNGPASAGSEPTPATNVRSALRLVAQHLRPLRLTMAIGLVLLVLAAVVGLGQPLATRYVLETVGAEESLTRPVILLVSLILAGAAAQGAGQYLMLRAAEDVVRSSRRRLVDTLLDLSVPSMRGQEPGDLMARVTSDTALIRQIALQSLTQFITGAVVIVGAIGVMIWLDAFLFVVTFAVVAVIGLTLLFIMPRIRQSSRETQQNIGAIGNELERILGAYPTVKAAGAEDIERERLERKVSKARHSGVRTALWNSLAAMTSVLAVQAAFVVVLGVGGWRAQSGAISVASLIAFLLYAMQLSAPVLQLTAAVTSFQAGRAALERIAEVHELTPEATGDGVAVEPSPLVPGSEASLGAVSWRIAASFQRVTFSYPDQTAPALREVSLDIPGVGLTAVVGPSGSGKSSLLKLLEGFYPLDAGAVCVAGRSVAQWDLGELRRHVAYVEQETPVFAGTLYDNLVYGQQDVDDDRVRAVLRRTGLQERVPGMEEAAEQVGHRGSALSGGERQRLAVARALLRSPRLLLLDEATSQLDASSEALMRELVADISQEIAVVIVAHRLGTVVGAERIVVMESGTVRAVGTHTDLLADDEVYARLVQSQQGQLQPTADA